MADRLKKRNTRLPSLLMLIIALSSVLFLGGLQSTAVHSLDENVPPIPPQNLVIDEKPEETAHHMIIAAIPAMETTSLEEATAWTGFIPESSPVEDTYFSDAVFLGDSRTDGFRLYSGLEQGTYLCATGATVESVFTKPVKGPSDEMPLLDMLAELECSKIYVMLGVNELGWAGTDIFRKQSAELIQRLQADHPEAKIIIQSILPVTKSQETKGTYVNNKRIAAYNEVWQTLAQEMNVSYLNVAEAIVCEDGFLQEKLTYDGVHLNRAGCQVWLDYLRTHPISVKQ